MARLSASSRVSSASTALEWRPTKIMHMRDLSKDDDFLSHLLVEKLGTGTVPLLVHKMDSSRRLPKTDTQALMGIVRRVRSRGTSPSPPIHTRRSSWRVFFSQLVTSKGPLNLVIKTAVDELLEYVVLSCTRHPAASATAPMLTRSSPSQALPYTLLPQVIYPKADQCFRHVSLHSP